MGPVSKKDDKKEPESKPDEQPAGYEEGVEAPDDQAGSEQGTPETFSTGAVREGEEYDEAGDEQKLGEVFECPVCHEKLSSGRQLRIHQRREH